MADIAPPAEAVEAPARPAATTPKKTLVVGGGAVGSFLGALMATAGHEVTLVRPFERAARARTVSLACPDGTQRSFDMRLVRHAQDAPNPDLMIVAVKMPAIREALEPTSIWPTVPTLTVENGIGAEAIAAELRPEAPRLAGSLTASIEITAENEVRWLRRGGLGLAAVNPEAGPVVKSLRADLTTAGLPSVEHRNAAAMKWSKLLTNLIANATGAILDMDPDEIYRDPRLYALERRQLREALAVMSALELRPVGLPGASIPWLARIIALPDVAARPILTRIVGGARGGKLPSLRMQMQAAGNAPTGEPTEVRWMNGAVAGYGDLLRIPTPVNSLLAELVDDVAAHPDRRAWLRRQPERLLAEL
jgi:2-dehydropantoate 2-reductase